MNVVATTVTPLWYTRPLTGMFTCIKYSEPLSASHYSGWRVTPVQYARPSAIGGWSSYLGYSVPLQGFLPEGKDRTSGPWSNFLFICLPRRERAREERGETNMISDRATSLTSHSYSMASFEKANRNIPKCGMPERTYVNTRDLAGGI